MNNRRNEGDRPCSPSWSQQQQRTMSPLSGAIRSRDVHRLFLAPPPAQLQHSALYQSLPEAALHNQKEVLLRVKSPQLDFSRLPARMAREQLRVVRPKSAPASAFEAPPPIGATSFMLEQQSQVNQYRLEYFRQKQQQYEQKQAKWGQMRANLAEAQQQNATESTKKKKMRLARQLAAQQLVEQHDKERELLGYEERKYRTKIEGSERATRHEQAFFMWKAMQSIQLSLNLGRLQQQEASQRYTLMDDFLNDTESRHRQYLLRCSTIMKTTIMSQEKAVRVTIMKYVTARTAWKNHQEAQLNAFLQSERKARQKVQDDEMFGFLEVDGLKQALLVEQARIARRRHEELLAEEREREAKRAEEKKVLERIEAEMRHSLKTEEANVRTVVRDDYLKEKQEAIDHTTARVEREKQEWDAACMQQLQPIMNDEHAERDELIGEEMNQFVALMAHQRQEWSDIMVPVAIDPHPNSVGLNATYVVGGPPVPLFPMIHLRRKMDPRHYPPGPLKPAVITITARDGIQLGDELDATAVEVASLKEKTKGQLRLLDSCLYDEDNSLLCEVIKTPPPCIEELETLDQVDAAMLSVKENVAGGIAMMKLVFPYVERDSVSKVVDRVLQSVMFKSDGTCSNLQQRAFELTLAFNCAAGGDVTPQQTGKFKRERRKSKVTGTATSVPLKYSIATQVAVEVSSPTMGIPPHFPAVLPLIATTVLYDLRKRPDNGKLFVSLFPQFSVMPSCPADWSNSSIRIRCVEGWVNEDALQLLPNDMFTLKKDELKVPDSMVTLAKFIGKLLPAQASSTKDIAIQVAENSSFSSLHLEKLIQKLQFACVSANPIPQRRVIDVTITSTRNPDVLWPKNFTLRSEVNVVGSSLEPLVINGFDFSTALVYRDSKSGTPEQLRKFVVEPQLFLCPNAVVEPRGPLASRDTIQSGYFRATVVQNAAPWDKVDILPSPQWQTQTNYSSGTLGIDREVKVMWGPQPNMEGAALSQVGKLRKFKDLEGSMRPGVQVDFTDAKSATVCALLRGLTFQTEGTANMIGVTKMICVEIVIMDSQSRKAKGAGAATPPVRFSIAVRIFGSSIALTAVNSIVPRSPGPVPIPVFSLSEDAIDDSFDGSSVTVSIVEGKSGTEEIALAARIDVDNGDDIEDAAFVIAMNAKNELALFRGSIPVGSVASGGIGQDVVINFSGRRKGDTKLEPLIKGSHVSALLRQLTYLHSDDSMLQKTVKLTVVDSNGVVGQAVAVWDVTPLHMPSEFESLCTEVQFRHRSVRLTEDGAIPLFNPECKIIDEDTEACGRGVMSAEPFVGFTSEDSLVLLQHPTHVSKEIPDGHAKITYHQHPVDRSKHLIHFDGKEVASCVDDSAAGGGNKLRFNIKSGTSLDVCNLLMHRVGFKCAEMHPSRQHVRQVLFRFNAGDEDVPDTKAILSISVNSPLLYTLPLFESIVVRVGHGSAALFPRVMLGVSSKATIGNTIQCTLDTTVDTDLLTFQANDNFSIENKWIICSVETARVLLNGIVSPTPGFGGVIVGKFEFSKNNTRWSLHFDKRCPLPAAALPALLACLHFENTSLVQTIVARSATVEWKRSNPTEAGFISCAISVEPQDLMTEIELRDEMVTCYEQEPCHFAAGSVVRDDDTDFFESDALLDVEVQGGISSQDTLGIVGCQGSNVMVEGDHIATLQATPTRKIQMHFHHCPIATISTVLGMIFYKGKDCSGKSKLVTILLRASGNVSPTIANLQIDVIPRLFDGSKLLPAEHTLNCGPTPIFRALRTVAPSFAGITLTVRLPSIAAESSQQLFGTALRLPVSTVDRVYLGSLPDHFVFVAAKSTITTKTGSFLCSVLSEKDQSSLTFVFPKTCKNATNATVTEILLSVVFECNELPAASGDAKGGKNAAPPKKGKGAAATEGAIEKKSQEKGLVGVELVATVQLDSEGEETATMVDRATVSVQ